MIRLRTYPIQCPDCRACGLRACSACGGLQDDCPACAGSGSEDCRLCAGWGAVRVALSLGGTA